MAFIIRGDCRLANDGAGSALETMMTPADVKDAWDFYICRVDDAPASIFMNFWFKDHPPPAGATTLYYLGLQILDEGPHGMGVLPDADALNAVEDLVSAAAAELGFYFVGRLRNGGDWQMTFYAEPGREEALRELWLEHVDNAERGYRLGSKDDPEWGYYHDFLLPDSERWRWMMNRRVIEQLQANGDSLQKKRTVDHSVHFDNTADREAFAAVVREQGFEVQMSEGDGADIMIELHRVDSVQLHDIHETVMQLERLAEQHHGDYDGWGTTVEVD